MVNSLLEELKPDQWPLPISQLPKGTAVVGGAIRDSLLKRLKKFPDLDLIVPKNAIESSQKLAKSLGGTCVVLDPKRDIARLVLQGWTIDLAKQQGKSLEEDLLRRDFTINAIALMITPSIELIDPANGIADLQAKTLVAIKEENLRDDPLRCLRAFRLLAEIKLDLDPKTKKWINNNHKLLAKSAPERIQSELLRLVHGPRADEVLPIIEKIGLLATWRNKDRQINYQSIKPKYTSLLTPKEEKNALPLLRLTNLLSDIGMEQLRFSKRQRQRCKLLRKWQKLNDGLGFSTLSEASRLELHKDLEEDLPALIAGLSKTYQLQWLKRWRNKNDSLFHPISPIDGHTLQQEFDISSGLLLGKLLSHLSHEKAFDRLHSKEDCIKAASYWLTQKQTLL